MDKTNVTDFLNDLIHAAEDLLDRFQEISEIDPMAKACVMSQLSEALMAIETIHEDLTESGKWECNASS
jgi:hypothetical protein